MHRYCRFAFTLALTLSAVAATCNTAHAALTDWHAPTLHGTWKDTYATNAGTAALQQIADAKFGTVVLTSYRYQARLTDSAVTVNDNCPSDSDIRTGIRQAKARGLKPVLKLHITCPAGWGGSLAPSNPAAWFTSWGTFVASQAELAQAEGAAMLVIGCEFQSLTKPTYSSYWRKIVAAARARYTGVIAYAANGGEYQQVDWWDAVDVIGVDSYWTVSTAAQPTPEQVTAGWQPYVTSYRALAAKWRKPLVISEVGYNSRRYSGDTWHSPASTVADNAGQDNCVRGTLAAWQAVPECAGIWWWEVQTGAGDPLGMSLNGKPAWQTLAKWNAAQVVTPPTPDAMPGLLSVLRDKRAAWQAAQAAADTARTQYEAAVAAVEAEATR
jgi:hypothetical protein